MGLVYGAARWTIRLTVGLVALLMTTKIIGGLWQRPMLMWIDGLSLGSMDLILGEIRTEPLAFENPALIWGVSWSRDGRWLAITRSSSNLHQHFVLEIIDLRTRNVVCEIDSAYEPPATYEFWYPVWRQNELLLQATFGTQQTNLYRIDPATCTRTQWSNLEEVAYIGYDQNNNLGVISNQRSDGYWLELWDPQTEARTPLNTTPLQRSRYWDWSEDQQWLIFGDHTNAMFFNPSTNELRPQEELYGRNYWRGTLLISSWRVNKEPELHELQLWEYADGQIGARIFYEKAYNYYSGRWTQDQTMFAYIRGIEGELIVFDTITGIMQSIGGNRVRVIAWSPDDRWLAFSDSNGLHRWNRTTGELQQLLPAPTEGYYHQLDWWGERLFVQSYIEYFDEYQNRPFGDLSYITLLDPRDGSADWGQNYDAEFDFVWFDSSVDQRFAILNESIEFNDCIYLFRLNENQPQQLGCTDRGGWPLPEYVWLP